MALSEQPECMQSKLKCKDCKMDFLSRKNKKLRERELTLTTAPHLHNFRLETVGLNQIRNICGRSWSKMLTAVWHKPLPLSFPLPGWGGVFFGASPIVHHGFAKNEDCEDLKDPPPWQSFLNG